MPKKKSITGGLTRKTIYVEPIQDKAIAIMAAIEKKYEYEIIISALRDYLPQEYLEMAKVEMAQRKK